MVAARQPFCYILNMSTAIFLSSVALAIAVAIVAYWYDAHVRFRRLRKDYPNLRTFEIRTTRGLFGWPYYDSPDYTCRAYNFHHAVERYINWYKRVYRCRPDLQNSPIETTFAWGKLEVKSVSSRYCCYFQ